MLFFVKFLVTTAPLLAALATSTFQTLGKRGGGFNRSSQCAVTRHLRQDSPRMLLAFLSPTWTWDANFQRASKQTEWHQTLQLRGSLVFTKGVTPPTKESAIDCATAPAGRETQTRNVTHRSVCGCFRHAPTLRKPRHGQPNHPRSSELAFDTFGGAYAAKFPET